MTREEEIEKPIDRSWPQFNEERFIPFIAESLKTANKEIHNCVSVYVDISKNSLLDFSQAIEEQIKIISAGYLIFYVLELSLSKNHDDYFDEVQFEAIRLGLISFQDQVLSRVEKNVFGIGFSFGRLNEEFSKNLMIKEKIKEYFLSNYFDFQKHFGFELENLDENWNSSFVKKEIDLYQIHILSGYLHRIASMIRSNIEIYAFFDFDCADNLSVLQYISNERFPYIRLGLKSCNLPTLGLNLCSGSMLGVSLGVNRKTTDIIPNIGLVFPSDQKLNFKVWNFYSSMVNKLVEKGVPFFVLYEDFMTENWQNLDTIILHSSICDHQMKRKCFGFSAADGRIVIEGNQIGFFEEVAFCDFLVDIR